MGLERTVEVSLDDDPSFTCEAPNHVDASLLGVSKETLVETTTEHHRGSQGSNLVESSNPGEPAEARPAHARSYTASTHFDDEELIGCTEPRSQIVAKEWNRQHCHLNPTEAFGMPSCNLFEFFELLVEGVHA